jgi:hypothetical protein
MNDVNLLTTFIVDIARVRAPVDTGNLKRNGLSIEGNVIIGGNEQVPYFEYTNTTTRNQGWFDIAVEQAVMIFCQRYGYDYKIQRSGD